MDEKKKEYPSLLPDSGSIYKKSNLLISAMYKTSLLENKCMHYAIYKIATKEYEDLGPDMGLSVTIPVNEIGDLLGLSKKGRYTDLLRMSKKSANRTIVLEDEKNDSFVVEPIISRIEYNKGDLNIRFSSSARKMMIDNARFTLLDIRLMLNFKSVFSLRLYEMLRSEAFQRKGEKKESFDIIYGLSELRLNLGVIDANEPAVRDILISDESDFDRAAAAATQNRYKTFGDLKRHVIDVAVNEINEQTDIMVSYDMIRNRTGVTKIRFTVVYKKDRKEETKQLSEKEKMMFLLKISKLNVLEDATLQDLEAVAEAADYEYDVIAKQAKNLESAKSVTSPIGWLISAIRNNYNECDEKIEEEKTDEKEVSISRDLFEFLNEACEESFNIRQIDTFASILKEGGVDPDNVKACMAIKNAYKIASANEEVGNKFAYICAILKKDLQQGKEDKTQKNPFRNFEERNEDYSDLINSYYEGEKENDELY